MNRFTFLIFFLSILLAIKAKADRFIYHGDTVYINSKNLLNNYPQFNKIKSRLPECYKVEWNVNNNGVTLNAIYRCATVKNPHLQKIDLKALFGTNKLTNLTWLNDTLWMPVGKPVTYSHGLSIYQSEIRLMVKSSKITSIVQFNYKNANKQTYDPKDLYSKINWSKLRFLNGKNIKLLYHVSIDENGKVAGLSPIFKSIYPACNEQVEKALKSTHFSTYHRHNQLLDMNTTIEVTLNDEMKRKYSGK